MLGSWLVLLVGLAGPAAAADWYVDPLGHDTNNTCQTAASPCRTIQAAINKAAASDTVHVAPGNYPFVAPGIQINKAGLTLQGQNTPFAVDPHSAPGTQGNQAANASVLQGATSSGNNRYMIWVNNVANVTIRNLYISHDLRGAREAIIATGNIDGLLVENNYVKFTGGSCSFFAPCSDRFGISINPESGAGMASSVATQPVNGTFVTLRNNVLEPTISGSTVYAPKRAILFNRSLGLIEGNQIAASTADLWTYQNTGTASTPVDKRHLTIQGNWFFGRLQNQINAISGTAEAIYIRNNQYIAPGSSFSPVSFPGVTPASLTSAESHMLRLVRGGHTIVEGNEFKGFVNQYRALWIQMRRNVEVRDNTFTPEPNAADFTAITVGNRPVETGVPSNPTVVGGLTIVGNTFESGAPGNKGKAIYFVNDNDKGGLASGDSPYVATVGGTDPVDTNNFDSGIGWYIALDDRSCDAIDHGTGTTSGCRGDASTPHLLGQGINYSVGFGSQANQKEPFRWHVNAEGNTFGGVYMPSMSQTQYDAVLSKTFDNDNNKVVTGATLGNVVYGWTAPAPAPDVELEIGIDPANSHMTGDMQGFTLAAENLGGPGLVRGRIIVSRVDGAPIPQQVSGIGDDAAADSLMVMTDFGPTDLVRSPDGSTVSLVWPPVDVPLDAGAVLPPQNIGVLFRVPGEYHVLAEIYDAAEPTTVYGSEQFTYAVTQDLAVTLSGDTTTEYNGAAQALAFSVSPASNPAVADLASKVALSYAGSATAPANAGTYAVTAAAADSDYVPQLDATDYTITPAPAAITWGELSLGYTGAVQTVDASIVPANTALSAVPCTVSPASIGPDVGSYALTADCAPQTNLIVTGDNTASASIGGDTAVRRIKDGASDAYFPTVAAALADIDTGAGDTLELAPGTYSGPIVLNKPVKLVGSVAFTTMTAGPDPMPTTIIDGGAAAGHGITVPANVEGVTIENLEVRNFGGDCIHAAGRNHRLEVSNNYVHHCNLISGRGGIYVNGSVAGVTIQDNRVHNASRGIILWNGVKADITVHNNHVHGPGTPSGILLNDGTATGVHITDNLVENTEDTGIALQQLTSGSPSDRANVISGNQVINPGRLGISLQVPNGTGAETGDGAILVENNEVSGRSASLPTIPTGMGTFPDDRAGISIVRRFFSASEGQIDVTRGVLIRNNTVRDFIDANPMREAYGIVVEGLGSTVAGNVLENNQFGLQIQQGNAGYPGDAPVGAPSDDSDWFDRGNAPLSCVAVGANAFGIDMAANEMDQRSVPADAGLIGGVFNEDAGTWHCSITDAIAAATAGDMLRLSAGTYFENVTINKSLTIKGPFANVHGDSAGRGVGEATVSGTLAIRAPDILIDGVTLTKSGGGSLVSHSGDSRRFSVINSRIMDLDQAFVQISNSEDWAFLDNYLANINGYGFRPHGGVPRGFKVERNIFRSVYLPIQMIGVQGGVVAENDIDGVVDEGSYTAIQVANSSNVVVRDNRISNARLGVMLDRNNDNVLLTCNDIGAGLYGIRAMSYIAAGTELMNIFHNRIDAPVHVSTTWNTGETFVVGSNFYDEALAVEALSGAAIQVADALAANPIGDTRCGINTPHSIVAYGGTGTQSAPVDTAFTDLRARVQDELGGAVMGVEVTFSDPSSSTVAGATLGTLVGNTDFNGELVTTAVANGFAGSYTVSAGSGSLLPASFALTNTQGTATVTVSDVTAVYNGTPHAVSVSTDPAGLEADVQIVYTDASSVVVATCAATAPACGPVNAGTYTAAATIVGNANYAGSGSGTLTISRAATSIVFAPLSFEYNGSTHIVSAHLADEPGSACPVTGTVGPDVAGSPYAVTASACTGINHEAPAATASAQVTPQPTTITLGHLVQAYDGAPKSVSVTTSPTIGVDVSLSYAGNPTPPSAIGSYLVEASTHDPNFSGTASATLEIVAGAGDIALVLSGPVDPVPVGELAHYAATMIANPALHAGETFGYQVVLNKTGGSPLAISDIATMEVFYQGSWVNPAHFGMDLDDLFSFDIDGNLVYQFPDGIPGYSAGFEIDEPLWTWNFRFSFTSPGVYTTSAQLVDGVTKAEISPPVLASIATVVVDELPPSDLHLVLSGPSGAVETGQLVEYAATLLADAGLHDGERFNIALRLQKSGGDPLTVADLAEVQVFDGTFWHVYPPSIVFDEVGGELVYVFPDASGFPITSDSTQAHVRVVYATTGVYTLSGELIDNADYADPDLAYVHSTAAVSTTVVDATVVIPEMHLLLSGPLDPVELGDTAQYTGTMIANPADFAGRDFFVRIRLAKNGGAEAMTAADLAMMELFHGSQWHDATTVLLPYLMADGNDLVYLFPRPAMDAGFPITSPVWNWNFRFTYGDTGVFSAVADVVDAADIADIESLTDIAGAASLASASVETTVVDTPEIVIGMQGPVVGEVGQPLQYIGSLDANPLPDASQKFYVTVRLSRNGGADQMTAADLAAMEISLDGGTSWTDFTGQLPLIQDGNYLTYDFPQPLMPEGFPITGAWSWDFRFTYASEGVYRAEAVVVTADAERTPVSNTETVQTTIFAQTPEIAIALQGPVSGIGVGDPAHYTGTLTADPLPDASEQFIVRVRLGKDGGSVPMSTADLTSMAISADGISWTLAPEVLDEIYPDPTDSNFLLYDFPNPAAASFPITGPWTWHFQFTYGSEGTYSAEATVLRSGSEEVASNTAGVATIVGLGSAHIAIDPASLYVVYDGNPKAAAVSTTPAGLDVTVTYDGASALPVHAGTYLVEAGIDAGQGYSGSASATLVIAKGNGTVAFDAPLSGSFGSTHAVIADIAEEPGASCTLGGVPAASDPVGSYLVTASCESANYTASGSALYEVTAGAGVSIEAVDAAPVGVVTVDPLPDADAKKSYFSWRTHGSAGEFVKGAFSISSGAASPQAGDLQVEYLEIQNNTWMPLSLGFNAGTGVWSGEFGPGTGFPLVDGATSQFRATFHKGGRYTTTASVVGLSGLVYATSAPVVTDVAQVRLSGVANAAGRVGEPIESSLTMSNTGTAALSDVTIPGLVEAQPAPNDENVRGRFTISWDGGALEPADPYAPGGNGSNCGVDTCASPDVGIEYFDADLGQYRPIYNLRQADDGQSLYGHFGALVNGGIPVWAGFDASTLFRTTFKQHTGTYTVRWEVIGIDTGTVYAQAQNQIIGIDEGQGAFISIVSGDAGEAVVGGNAYDLGDLVVEVRNIYNNPVPGAAVTFNVLPGLDGAGAVLGTPQVTDADGRTSITAVSNDVAGGFEVSASLSNGATLVHPFVLGNLADSDPAQVQLVAVSGDSQTAQVGTAYGLPLVVKATDRFGNALQGIDVAFQAPASGASVTPASAAATTDADGLADSGVLSANAVAGDVAIDVSVDAAQCDAGSADAVCAIGFGLTNTAGGADSLTLTSSVDQAEAGSAGAYVLTATVFDTDANPVPGVSVTLIGPNAGAGIAPAVFSAITDADGQVVQTFDANTTAGVFQVQAVVSGVSPAMVELENLAGAAAKIALVSGDRQSAAVGSAFAEALVVQVLDQYDNPVADDEAAVVNFTSVDNGVDDAGADVPATATSAADGLVSVNATANAHVGSYSVVASFNGHDVSFTLANTTGAVTISDIVWADSGTATVAYDGNAKAATATVAGSSAAPVFTYNGSSSEPVNAGTYLVIATVDDGNVFGSASAMLTIEPAAAGNTGIDLTGGSFVYDGVAKPATVTNPDGVSYTLAYSTANGLAPVNAGSYTATLTVTDPNHAADTLTATIEITPAPVELLFGSLSHVYDGTAKSATVTTTPAGVTGVSLSYSPDAAPVNAGSYEVEATLANPNHVLTGITTAELVIDKATAQIFLSNLTQMYDGTQKAVTVTTVPAALAADVEVSYTPAVPVNVGSYAVEALLEGHPNYEDGPANATLSIIAATIAGFEIIGDDSFSGVAGDALTGALPTVRVYDTSGLGVPGISVEFAVTAGAGSIEGAASAAVTTGADGHATVPEWVLGAVAGANTMTAATGMAGLQELEFSATGEQVAQLSIDKSVNLTQAHAGQVLDYSIVVANDGPSTVQATLLDAIPDGLEDISWICLGEDGALCGEASGNGDIDFDSTIPAGGSITVTISATVAADATTGQAMVNTAVVTWLSEGEEQEAEASASTNIVPAYSGPCSIFCDGFEDIDLGKRLALPEAADAAAVHGWDLVSGQSGRPQLAVELVDGAGQAVAWLDSLKIGEQSMVRLRSLDGQGKQRAGTWQAWPAGASVNYGWELDFDGLRLDFVPAGAAKAGLHLRLPAGAAIPERARSHAATAH